MCILDVNDYQHYQKIWTIKRKQIFIIGMSFFEIDQKEGNRKVKRNNKENRR